MKSVVDLYKGVFSIDLQYAINLSLLKDVENKEQKINGKQQKGFPRKKNTVKEERKQKMKKSDRYRTGSDRSTLSRAVNLLMNSHWYSVRLHRTEAN